MVHLLLVLFFAASLQFLTRVNGIFDAHEGVPPLTLTDVSEEYFPDQIVDHFDSTDTRTWSQRYFSSNQFYKEGGPLIIMIGGEAPLNGVLLSDMYSTSYFAKELNGLAISLEHRFYGKSVPETTTENIQLLSSRQALADLARFIPYIKAKHGMTNATKTIVMGGSYPGSLAAWARKMFPFIIDAAISSSGPYLAQSAFPEYLDHVERQVRKFGGDNCADIMARAIERADYLLSISDVTTQELCTLFPLDPQKLARATDLDRDVIAEGLFTEACVVVQYAKTPFNDFSGKGSIQAMCEFIEGHYNKISINSSAAALIAYSLWLHSRYFDGYSVMQSADEYVAAMKNTSVESPVLTLRSWFWQTCSEFGYYQSTLPGHTQFFGKHLSLEGTYEFCWRIYFQDKGFTLEQFKEAHEQAIADTNAWYGARNVARDGIFITNGDVDPWSQLSVLATGTWENDGQYLVDGNAFEIVVNGSHCTDLYMTWFTNEDVRTHQLDFLKKVLHI